MVKPGQWLSRGWAAVQPSLGTHVLIALIVGLGSALTVGLLSVPLMACYYRVMLRQLRDPGYRPQVGDLGEGFDVFVQALLAGIVIGVAAAIAGGVVTVVTFIVSFVPIVGQVVAPLLGSVFAVCVIALTLFVVPLITDRRLDFWAAIQLSIQTVTPRFVEYLGFAALIYLLNALGGVLCGIGALFTMPAAVGATSVAYLEIMGVAPGGEEAPPPPAANPGQSDPTAPNTPG